MTMRSPTLANVNGSVIFVASSRTGSRMGPLRTVCPRGVSPCPATTAATTAPLTISRTGTGIQRKAVIAVLLGSPHSALSNGASGVRSSHTSKDRCSPLEERAKAFAHVFALADSQTFALEAVALLRTQGVAKPIDQLFHRGHRERSICCQPCDELVGFRRQLLGVDET